MEIGTSTKTHNFHSAALAIYEARTVTSNSASHASGETATWTYVSIEKTGSGPNDTETKEANSQSSASGENGGTVTEKSIYKTFNTKNAYMERYGQTYSRKKKDSNDDDDDKISKGNSHSSSDSGYSYFGTKWTSSYSLSQKYGDSDPYNTKGGSSGEYTSKRSTKSSLSESDQEYTIKATRGTRKQDDSSYCSTSSYVTEVVSDGQTETATTWRFAASTRDSKYGTTDLGTKKTITQKNLIIKEENIPSYTKSSWHHFRLHDYTVYLDSDEAAWTMIQPPEYTTGTSSFRVGELFSRVNGTSFKLEEKPKTYIDETTGKRYTGFTKTETFESVERYKHGSEWKTRTVIKTKRTEYINGRVFYTHDGKKGGYVIKEKTSRLVFDSDRPTYTRQVGPSSNPSTKTYIDLVVYKNSSDGKVYQTTDKVESEPGYVEETYHPWYGSSTTTFLAEKTIKTTSVAIVFSYMGTGNNRPFAGYRSYTNECLYREYIAVKSTAWDAGLGLHMKLKSASSHWGDQVVNDDTKRKKGYTKSWEGGSSFSSIKGIYKSTKRRALNAVYTNSGMMFGHKIGVITPVNASGYLGFGGKPGLERSAVYAQVGITSAGAVFEDWQKLTPGVLRSLAVAIKGGYLFPTDSCSLPGDEATYRWSGPGSSFARQSTLLATYSSTYMGFQNGKSVALPTYKYATYRLGVKRRITGNFVSYKDYLNGTAMSNECEHLPKQIHYGYFFSFEKEDDLRSDRTLVFEQGLYSVTTNKDGSFIGSGEYTYTQWGVSRVMPNGEEWYIESEPIVTVEIKDGYGTGYKVL